MKQFIGYRKGINLGGWLSQCCYTKEHYDTFITESDIERIFSLGFDHVRVPVDYQLIETEAGEKIESGYEYIDKCLLWCKKYGINMILDIHKTAGYSFDRPETSGGFFRSAELQDRFIALWDGLSRRYGAQYQNMTFELLNEVVEPGVSDIWNGIIERAIETIRNNAPEINIIIGGVCYNGVFYVKNLPYPRDEHIVYTFHCYEPVVFTHQTAEWVDGMPSDFSMKYHSPMNEYAENSRKNIPAIQSSYFDRINSKEMNSDFFEEIFAEAIAVAEERNVPLYCGEYGVIDRINLDDTLEWFKDINKVFERHEISRSVWTYKKLDFGLIDEHYAPIFDELIKVL